MSAYTGTGQLIRLILRRDRVILPVWVGLLGLLPVFYASATRQVYPTDLGIQQYYQSVLANPSFTALLGPAFAPNLGAMTAWRAAFNFIFIGLAALLSVVRHTRAEEDAGRRELLGATVLGRLAPLTAALLVTATACVAVGTLVALTMIAYGQAAAGSLALGAAFTALGLAFAGIGAVAAQLTEGAGAARGLGIAVLGATYLLRAAGDAGGTDAPASFLSWLSPMGWAQQVRPYADERWWALGLLIALAAVGTAGAFALQARRDLGAGIVPPRPGPAEGRLASPLALAWRLQRGSLFAWSAGLLAGGLVVGGATQSIDTLTESSPQMAEALRRMGGVASLREIYLAAALGLFGLIISAYGVQATLRLRAEEANQRAEPVLAAAVSRPQWTLSHLVFALLGPAVALAVGGAAMGLVYGAAIGDVGGQVPRIVGAALIHLPAVWLLVGLTLAAFGLAPRLSGPVGWGAVAVCSFITFVGTILQLDQLLLDVSPFTHIPKLPGGAITLTPLAWIAGITALLVAGGFAAFRRRDLASGA